MRLKQHINESSYDIMGDSTTYNMDDFNEIIHSECKPYLKLISQTREPLLRGMRGVPKDAFGSKKVRKNRKPLQMEPDAADFLNKWLQKNGHARRDKSVICSPDASHLTIFGAPFYIFPAGRIKYTWIESTDLNFSYVNSGWDGDAANCWYIYKNYNDDDKFHIYYIACERMITSLKKGFSNYFHSNNFAEGFGNGFEFWIECSHYYFAPLSEYVWDHKYKALV